MWKKLIDAVRGWLGPWKLQTTAACPWCDRDVQLRYTARGEVFVAHDEPVCGWWVYEVREAADPNMAVESLLLAGKLQPRCTGC